MTIPVSILELPTSTPFYTSSSPNKMVASCS